MIRRVETREIGDGKGLKNVWEKAWEGRGRAWEKAWEKAAEGAAPLPDEKALSLGKALEIRKRSSENDC